MFRVYDKAQWHIDAGEQAEIVVSKFIAVFEFLDAKGLLDDEGNEILELGIDSSVSIHERMLNEKGNLFMEQYYDKVIECDPDKIVAELEVKYAEFLKT